MFKLVRPFSRWLYLKNRYSYVRFKFIFDIFKGKYFVPLFKLLLVRFKTKYAIDVGANVGDVVSILLLLRFKVTAYEPSSEAFHLLKHRFGSHPSVTLYNLALSDKEKTVRLFHHKDFGLKNKDLSQCSSLYQKPNLGDKFETVKAISLLDALSDFNSSDQLPILKIDIEGAEYDLENDLCLLSHMYHKAFIEIHENIPYGIEKLSSFRSRLAHLVTAGKIDLNWH